MGVEKGAGLQVGSQLALNDVAHGAVVRQADESRSVHEVGAAEGQSWVVAPDPGPAHLRPLPPPSRASLGGLAHCTRTLTPPLRSGWSPAKCTLPSSPFLSFVLS